MNATHFLNFRIYEDAHLIDDDSYLRSAEYAREDVRRGWDKCLAEKDYDAFLEVLRDPPYDFCTSELYVRALHAKDLAFVRWLHAHDVPWNWMLMHAVARFDQFWLFEYLWDHGAPLFSSPWVWDNSFREADTFADSFVRIMDECAMQKCNILSKSPGRYDRHLAWLRAQGSTDDELLAELRCRLSTPNLLGSTCRACDTSYIKGAEEYGAEE